MASTACKTLAVSLAFLAELLEVYSSLGWRRDDGPSLQLIPFFFAFSKAGSGLPVLPGADWSLPLCEELPCSFFKSFHSALKLLRDAGRKLPGSRREARVELALNPSAKTD